MRCLLWVKDVIYFTVVLLNAVKIGSAIVTPSYHVDGLVQERGNSSANTLELRHSCTNPLMSSDDTRSQTLMMHNSDLVWLSINSKGSNFRTDAMSFFFLVVVVLGLLEVFVCVYDHNKCYIADCVLEKYNVYLRLHLNSQFIVLLLCLKLCFCIDTVKGSLLKIIQGISTKYCISIEFGVKIQSLCTNPRFDISIWKCWNLLMMFFRDLSAICSFRSVLNALKFCQKLPFYRLFKCIFMKKYLAFQFKFQSVYS